MKKIYEKPSVVFERFLANVAVASCERVWNGEVEESWGSQPITCNRLNATTDYLFASGTTGCQYEPCHMIWVEKAGNYTAAQLNSMGLEIAGVGTSGGKGGQGSSGGTVTVPDGGGYVLCWDKGNHYGLATPEIVKVLTSSF